MQLTPEIKAQLTEQKKQCIFCKLISGEMPAKTVFEDDLTIFDVFLGDFNTGYEGIDLNVGRAIVLHNPVVECPHYIRSARTHRHRKHSILSYCSSKPSPFPVQKSSPSPSLFQTVDPGIPTMASWFCFWAILSP